jgi:EamA domain-containing membrane protein RarD
VRILLIFSVILSRIFLKEKLSKAQYAVIIVVILGIALLGIADEL